MAQDDAVKAVERQLKALELRKAGVTYVRIAEALGYANPMGAWKAVNAALKKTLQEPSDDLRKIEVERLDAMLFALYPSAMKGMQGAVDRVLKIMERRAKLLGLDAPTKADITTNGKELGTENNAGYERAISTLANALREIVPAKGNGEKSEVDTAK